MQPQQEEQRRQIEEGRKEFLERTSDTLQFPCSCCHRWRWGFAGDIDRMEHCRTFFNGSVHDISCWPADSKRRMAVTPHLHPHPLIAEMNYICNTCYKGAMASSRIRLECNADGPTPMPVDLPEELQGLSSLEYLLISPRILFQRIRQLPRGGQVALHGTRT